MDTKRLFLETALTTGIECKLITPDDVLRHIEPDILASHLPDDAKTQLLSASLKAGRMDATLVFETIAPSVFAENMPEAMLWSCIAEAAERALGDGVRSLSGTAASGAPKPTSLLGDTAASRLAAQRRPNATRRPARLTQPLPPRTTTPGTITPGTAGKRSDYDLDAEMGGPTTASAPVGSGPVATSPAGVGSSTLSPGVSGLSGATAGLASSAAAPPARAGKELLDEPFSDWVEETVTGSEALNRRKR